MKFRPQIQLRFRDEAGYVAVKEAAGVEGLSVNEWVLRRTEDSITKGGTQRLQGGGTGTRGTPGGSGETGSTRVRSAPRGEETLSPNVGSSPTPATKSPNSGRPIKLMKPSEQLRAMRDAKS